MTLTGAQRRILDGRVVVRDQVVYRRFADETVALNLESGAYYGLNGVAGEMIAALDEGTVPREVARGLAETYEVPLERVQQDLAKLCSDMVARGLIEVRDPERD